MRSSRQLRQARSTSRSAAAACPKRIQPTVAGPAERGSGPAERPIVVPVPRRRESEGADPILRHRPSARAGRCEDLQGRIESGLLRGSPGPRRFRPPHERSAPRLHVAVKVRPGGALPKQYECLSHVPPVVVSAVLAVLPASDDVVAEPDEQSHRRLRELVLPPSDWPDGLPRRGAQPDLVHAVDAGLRVSHPVRACRGRRCRSRQASIGQVDRREELVERRAPLVRRRPGTHGPERRASPRRWSAGE